ncbi:MAG: hypothetical protein M3R63_04010 [Actinomycetota bacterium]|nr:hypothetical protein [Actinomycetota bacterium]
MRDVIKNVIDGIPPPIPLIDIFGNSVETDSDEEPELWILMATFHKGMIYSELSRPTARDGGTITRYSARIQLPPLPFNDVDPNQLELGDTPKLPDSTRIDIDIQPLDNRD